MLFRSVTTLIRIVTIVVLMMTWSAAHHAARAASEQAAAAKALTEVSKAQQIATERAAAAAEAQVAAAEASGVLARQQLLAVQESAAAERVHSELIRQQTLASLRPILAFSRRTSSSGFMGWTVLENQSEALALEISAYNGTPECPGKPISVSPATMAPGVEAHLEGIDWGPPKRDPAGQPIYPSSIPVFAWYRSPDGRWFHTSVDLAEPVRHQVMEEELGN